MGAPSIKIRKAEQFWNKISLTGCKWYSLNAPSTETHVSHSLNASKFESPNASHLNSITKPLLRGFEKQTRKLSSANGEQNRKFSDFQG